MTIHELKTIPPYWEDVAEGRKQFEIRHTLDRTFAVGDELLLDEWEPDDEEGGRYTGRRLHVTVTYILAGPGLGVPANLAIMGVRRMWKTERPAS